MYFLSGGPLWTFNSCNAENITEDLRYSRPPLTSEEKKILSQSLSKTVDENSLMATFEFLKDQKESKDFIPRRFMTSAPMGQVRSVCLILCLSNLSDVFRVFSLFNLITVVALTLPILPIRL